MSGGSNSVEKFRTAIAQSISNKVRKDAQMTLEYATVVSVQADGTCTVQMLSDEDGVHTDGISFAAIGNVVFEPLPEAKCIIAHIMNNDAEGMILWCDQIKSMKFNGDEMGGILDGPKLLDELAKLKAFQSNVQQVFSQWVVVASDGGAALKTLSTQFTNLQAPDFGNLVNEKIKHGQQ